MLVGLIINSVMDILNDKLMTFFPIEALILIYLLNLVIVYGIITLLFTIIFRTLPDGKINLGDCLKGAAFTSLLFMLGKFAIGAYLGSSAIASVYGAAGSVILILVWVYYSAIILYFGAEFTKVYAHTHGQNIVPYDYTVKIVKTDNEIV